MSMNPQDPQHWEMLFAALMQPNTEVIREASEKLGELVKQPTSVVMIFERLTNSQDDGVRQQAAVVLRKIIAKHWGAIADDVTEAMKVSLTEIITAPQTFRVIRKATADIAVAVAKLTVAQGKWPAFFPWVITLVNSELPQHREIGLYFFQVMMESHTLRQDIIVPHREALINVLVTGLQDNQADVRVRAMYCTVSFITMLDDDQDDETAILMKIVPLTVLAIKLNIEQDDERLNPGFEVLELAAENHIQQIEPLLPELIKFMLTVGADSKNLDISVRRKALLYLEYMINYKPKTFCKMQQLENTIDVAMSVMLEPDDDYSGEDTGSKYGSQVIDTITLQIPAKHVWPLLSDRVQKFLQSPDPEANKAAIQTIAIMADGCGEQVSDNFDQLMECVLNGFKKDPIVQQAACIAIAEFAKNMPELLPPFGDQLVPVLLTGIHSKVDLVRTKSCYAISQCSTSLAEHFMVHIEPMLNCLVSLLTDVNPEVQELAVSALSSVVDMAETRIEPYFDPIINMMKKWLSVTDKDHLMVRARASECIGALASAQPTLFLPHFKETIELVLQGLSIDDSELREFTYGYCEHMVRLFPEQLTPYVDGLIPYLLGSIISMEGLHSFADDESFIIGEEEDDDFDSEPVMDSDMNENEPDYNSVSHFIDEKEAAISCLGWIAFTFCSIFEKYIPKSLDELIALSSFTYSPTVPAAAVTALVQICSCALTLVDKDYYWTKGVVTQLNPQVLEIIQQCVETMTANFDLHDDCIVRASIDALAKMGLAFGPVALKEHMTDIVDSLRLLLNREAVCQQVRESFEEDDENEQSIFNVVMETISALARVFGETLVPFLGELFPSFKGYLENNSPPEYQNICVATIAEVAQELKVAFKPFCAAFLPFTVSIMLNTDDKHAKHNACYAAALLVEYGEEAAFPFFEQICHALSYLFSLKSKKYNTVLDNACGTLARLILSNPQLVPLDQVVPVLIDTMPLRDDMEPASHVYDAIIALLKISHPSVVTLLPRLISLFTVELVHGQISDEVKAKLIEVLKGLIPSVGPQMNEIMEQLVRDKAISEEALVSLRSYLV